MATAEVININNEKVSEIELNDFVFNGEVKKHLFYEIVKMQLANRRGGNASTKGRSLVRGGGAKPWRQKGTGRARAGTIRSPLWRGGGVVFGPKPRDYSYRLPKKMRKSALRSALSLKFKEGKLKILNSFELSEIKTKSFLKVMDNLNLKNVLIVTDNKNENLEKSARNVPHVRVLRQEGLNVYDILRFDNLLLLEKAIKPIEDRLIR
ncbi:MAG: 50S ribosomal protein L4 [Deltaproteobacteria bacterium]|nr:50S ribosomal protein L4 [Deltaproteobacteria bacterium]RLA91471.1 MAG: 50S ribosomal protein L4 [Deltaproteobacteria bacterium]